jgi:hypothetical protein
MLHPLPLRTYSCLKSAWQALPPAQQAAAAPAVVGPLSGLLAAPGFSWSTWLSTVNLAAGLIAAAAAPGGAGLSVAMVPLAGGLVHVLTHSTVSQLRGRCLEALLQLLQVLEGGPADGTAAFNAAGDLADGVAACLATVSAQDPSVAHKALAGQAAAALQRIVG